MSGDHVQLGSPEKWDSFFFLSESPIYYVTHLALREEPGKNGEEIDLVKRQREEITLIIVVFKNGRKLMPRCRTERGC